MKIYSKFPLLFLLTILTSSSKKQIDADILIVNGTVYDGISKKSTKNVIAIKEDKIVFFGDIKKVNIKATKTIDAKNMIVAPGFIDAHTHADRDLIKKKESHNKPFLFQGITTVVVGNDGISRYPLQIFFETLDKNGIGTNVVSLIGHGTIRSQVIGRTDRLATEKELKTMQALIQREMDAGAFGISTGLFYTPGNYANTYEVIELSKIVAQNDGIYDTHMRDESSFSIGVINSVKETIEIGEKSNIPVHISHIKCLGVDVWNKSTEIINLVNEARDRGINVTANHYPYAAGATGMFSAVVPAWAQSGGVDSTLIKISNPELTQKILEETKENIIRRGGPEKLLVVNCDEEKFLGKNLLEISKDLNMSPEIAAFEVIKARNVRIASFSMIEEDIVNFMKQDWVVTGSDGNTGHPRKFGTFPKKYKEYVVEKKVIDLPSFINKSTSKTAEIFKIKNRGTLKEGFFADIIIFNPKTFKDKADYADSFQLAEGLNYAIINGKISIENYEYTNALNGRVLKKQDNK